MAYDTTSNQERSSVKGEKNTYGGGDDEKGTTCKEDRSKLECMGARHMLVIMGFLGTTSIYALRVNLSVAIVAMVNKTSEKNYSSEGSCPVSDDSYTDDTGYTNGEFDWDEYTQGMVLGSFYWGYLLTNIIGGRTSEYFGGRLVAGSGLLVTALLTLASPAAARSSSGLFIVVRVLEGCSAGVTLPAMNSLIASWFPTMERSKYATIIFSGMQFGTIVAMTTSGFLCSSDFLGGWPSVFYIYGVAGIIWAVFWFWLIRDNPRHHPTISDAELSYILKGCPETIGRETIPVPWLEIFKSKYFWIIAVVHFGNNWGFYTLLTELPTYLDQVLHVDMKNNGLISAVPSIGSWVFSIVYSLVTGQMISSGSLSILNVRKLSMAIAGYGPMLCSIVMCFVNCNQVWALTAIFISGTLDGSMYCGYLCSHADIAPAFAGTLMGMTNTFGTVPGFVVPAITGVLTANYEPLFAWKMVFLITAVIYAVTTSIYVLFITTERQPWNYPKLKESQKDDAKFQGCCPEMPQNTRF